MASLIQDFLIKSKEMPLHDLIKTVSKPNKFSALIKFADISQSQSSYRFRLKSILS